MRSLLGLQFVRFLLVGGLNTAFSYCIYAALLFLGLPYVLANFLALAAGIVFSFHTQSALVFANRNRRLMLRFAVCWVVVFGVNILLIRLFLGLGLNAYWAGAVALIPIVLFSYFVQKVVVFGGRGAVVSGIADRRTGQ